jgi:hypothetical protein
MEIKEKLVLESVSVLRELNAEQRLLLVIQPS